MYKQTSYFYNGRDIEENKNMKKKCMIYHSLKYRLIWFSVLIFIIGILQQRSQHQQWRGFNFTPASSFLLKLSVDSNTHTKQTMRSVLFAKSQFTVIKGPVGEI